MVYKFFTITDNMRRNFLMISIFYGYMGMFSDFLASINFFLKNGHLTRIQVEKILKARDIEGNGIVDLACIRGYNVDEDFLLGKKVTEEEFLGFEKELKEMLEKRDISAMKLRKE